VDIERTMEFILEQAAATEASLARVSATMDRLSARVDRHDEEMKAIRNTLRRAVRLAVEEQRRERAKRRELDEKITQLAAAQLLAEEQTTRLREAFENWLRRQNGNGYPPPA
jgi:ABC-type transporter Mla subunit MlaD